MVSFADEPRTKDVGGGGGSDVQYPRAESSYSGIVGLSRLRFSCPVFFYFFRKQNW